MEACFACPRKCGADRDSATGFCGEYSRPALTRAAPHYWEEPCISGTNGSGTVFFSGCNLRCVFCQNSAISRGGAGKTMDTDALAAVFMRLADTGVHNINLVTPTHFSLSVRHAVLKAKALGLSIPIVWNSSGYESVEILGKLDGIVDIYMPDFKYVSRALSARYSGAADYFEVAKSALDEMVLQRGGACFDGGIMKRGVIVRHLVLPGCVEDSKSVLRFLHRRYGNAIYISVMKQYTPMCDNLPDELGRRISEAEYREVTDYAEKLGIENGFFQTGDPVGESFVPRFDFSGLE